MANKRPNLSGLTHHFDKKKFNFLNFWWKKLEIMWNVVVDQE